MQYINVIKMAFLFFPIIAVVLTLPFLIYHYRKYGSISPFRTILLFSFFFYLICCYFLVVLPLPSRSSVANYTKPYYNLRPFYFVSDLLSSNSFNYTDFKTYSILFKNSKFSDVIFNILMVIPFGVYLRYYFKCGFFKTLFYSFLLSLFFELTQLSGLYFIYPRPYRLFDVNDLISNSFGGLIGYLICPIICFFLPDREKIDANDYTRGCIVSFGRRFVALFIDYSLIFIIFIFFSMVFRYKYIFLIYLVLNFLYFVFIYYFFQGFTFGKWFVNYRTVSNSLDGRLSFFKVFIKWILLHLIIFNGWFLILLYYFYVNSNIYLFMVIYFSIFSLFCVYVLLCWILNKALFYDVILDFESISVSGGMEDDEI